jgi:hypothetical protein
MEQTGVDAPGDLLPEAFARLQQINQDAVASAISKLTGKLKRALG